MREARRGGSGERTPGRVLAKPHASHRHARSHPPPAAAGGAARTAIDLSLQNPRRYAEAADPGLKPWLQRLLEALAPAAGSFAARFVSDREMHRLNLSHRGHDHTTDVLSFAGARTLEGWHLGDVVISIPQARRQAEAAGHPVAREVRVLLLHGVLHCLGHDHERDGGAMERLERRLRRRWLDGR
jgi:probable rRNA maturation factor